jgi:hypothetical protein
MAGSISYTMEDWGAKPETTVFRVPVTDITAANYDAQVTLIQSLRTQIMLMTVGSMKKYAFTSLEVEPTPVGMTPLAQRENKWLIRYRDEVANKDYRAELGTADLTLLTVDEFLDISTGVGATFVAAFEALVESENGNPVVVQSIQYVGRST